MGLEPNEAPRRRTLDASELYSLPLRQEQALHHPVRQKHLTKGLGEKREHDGDGLVRNDSFIMWAQKSCEFP